MPAHAQQRFDRSKANQWLYARTRPGFYLQLNTHLHLAYADQRDGAGSQHWWRLFFDRSLKEQIETITRCQANLVGADSDDSSNSKGGRSSRSAIDLSRLYDKEWGGMYFRSDAEISIARELDQKNMLFFANARGRVSGQGATITRTQSFFTGRLEVDFLIFYRGKCLSLEVDGQHHSQGDQVIRDYGRDRLLLREGIPTVRFTAQECLNQASDVVSELLHVFSELEESSPRHL